MRKNLEALLEKALSKACQAGLLSSSEVMIEIAKPRQEGHGDLATNLALILAGQEKKPPREVAGIIIDNLGETNGFIDKVEIAGPGFINFTLSDKVWQKVVRDVLDQGEGFGRTEAGQDKKVQVEFVSANPTGPLHVGHGRGAALGDALANLLDTAGYRVQREYYINDAGRQMLILGGSVFYRYQQLLGREPEEPEELYRGEYIKEIAAKMVELHGPAQLDLDLPAAAALFYPLAAEIILNGIKEDLAGFGVGFDLYFSEKSLHDSGRLKDILNHLKDKGIAYESEGALWYKTEEHGDEKDRVLVKSNGDLTYFAADVAYHTDKFQRGFSRVIDVWGADHHGYIPRMTAAVEALSQGRMELTCKLVQLVNLLRSGKPVQMSTRAGEFVTLREVVEEVGKDACRFIFLTRRSESHLDFDLDVAKSQSLENPVYYVQYVHARVASIHRKADESGIATPEPDAASAELLTEPEELNILKTLAQFPELIVSAAESLEPHRLTYYLTDLASSFHNYYNRHRVLTDDPALTGARLALADAVQQVVRNGLRILGVSAPYRMDREEPAQPAG